MKTSHLHDVWASPDNNRLVSKQFSFRFPVHIAAKIAALSEIYPQKNRTQIVADLLTAALDDLEKNLPSKIYGADPEVQRMHDEYHYDQGMKPEILYELGGIRAQYRNACNKHYSLLEKELGNDNPTKLYDSVYGSREYLENFTE
ncbi:MAG: hypothetical protein Q7V02_05285 [Methylophilus sp.]|nr:hypothetical protein [Methylophilus sp.]